MLVRLAWCETCRAPVPFEVPRSGITRKAAKSAQKDKGTQERIYFSDKKIKALGDTFKAMNVVNDVSLALQRGERGFRVFVPLAC